MIRLVVRGEAPDCRCFGSLGSTRVGRGTLARTAALLALAAFTAVAGHRDPGTGLGDLDAGVLVLGGIMIIHAAFSWQLFGQNGRLLARVTTLEAAVGVAEPVPDNSPLPIGAPAPAFLLPDVDGLEVSLDDLLRAGRGVLLVFSDPACGHCDPLLPALRRRTGPSDVPVALISRGSREDNRAKAEEHGIWPLLLQADFEVAAAYRVYGLPGAVLVGPDGRIAGQIVTGAAPIAELLDRIGTPDRLPVLQFEGGS
jgi:peroxiredoxin